MINAVTRNEDGTVVISLKGGRTVYGKLLNDTNMEFYCDDKAILVKDFITKDINIVANSIDCIFSTTNLPQILSVIGGDYSGRAIKIEN